MPAHIGLMDCLKAAAAFARMNARTALVLVLVLIPNPPTVTAGGGRRPASAEVPAPTRAVTDYANHPAQNSSGAPPAGRLFQKFDGLVEKASARGSVRVIVGLQSNFTPEGELGSSQAGGRRAEIRREQESLLERLEAYGPENVKQFKSIPYLAMTVNAAALQHMKESADVESIREDKLNRPSLAESTKVVEAPAAWQMGFSGQGQVIAILDTGVDKNHPFLAGKVISEACFSTNYADDAATSLCPAGVEESTAANSALPCTLGKEKECDHGTHVAGIAAGRAPSGDRQGVAKDASLVAIQVHTKVADADECFEGSPCIRTYDSDYMLALEHVLALRLGGMNIASANLSFGEEEHADNCDEEYRDIKRLIDNLQSAGIATVVSSGNGESNGGVGYTNAMTVPACISSAVSVGSVGDGSPAPDGKLDAPRDVISKFSNRSPLLSLLAPGAWINSSGLNGGFETYSGTSMAAPHVAGAWAVLKQRVPNASVAQVLAALRNTGKPVDAGAGNGLILPRINVAAALQALLNCGYALSPLGRSVAAAGDIGAFNIAAPAGCPWTATSSDDWILAGGGGSGSGTVVFTVAPNSGAARAGAVYAGGQTFIVEQAAGVSSTGRFRLVAAGGQPKDLMGRSVAVSGGTAIAGAPGDNIGTNINQGSAYVFVRNFDGTWSQQAKLVAPDGGAGDEFGCSVAIDGDTVVVGARSHAIGSRPNQGAAYVFVRSGTTWTPQVKLISTADTSLGTLDDNFGEAVAIYRDRVVVGSPGFETFDPLSGLFQRGAVYIFNRSGTTWTPDTQAIQGGLSEKIGGSIATTDFTFQGNVVSAIMVGKPNLSPGSILGSPPSRYGAVTLYIHASGSIPWPEVQRVFAADFADGDGFGSSVAFASDGTAVVGSPSDDTGTMLDHGSAYVLVPCACSGGVRWTQQAKLTADDAAASDKFGTSVGISGNSVIVGAPFDDVNENSNQGSAYIFERAGSNWLQKRKLTAEDGESSDEFGTSVGISQGTALAGAASDDVIRGAAYVFEPSFLNAASTVQFASASYSVSESARKVLITVNRTGSTAAAASVKFASADGNGDNAADSRKDYTQTLGTLNFAPGEGSKTITVFVTDDALPESPETFTVSLSNASGAVIGAPGSTTVVINSDDVAVGPNPVDPNSFSPEFFVRQHYVDFLNREPDAAGLAFWVGNFTECRGNQQCLEAKRVNVSAAFFLSIEFQETGYLVYRFYKSAFGDAASPGVAGTVPVVRLDEFQSDTRSIGEGVQVGVGNWALQLDNNKVAYALDFVQRPRFLAEYPVTTPPALFVDALNFNAGGVLSPAERQQLIAELSVNNTTLGRANVLRKVAEDADLRNNELRRAFVLMQYFGYLRRNPDDPQDTNYAGWKFWLDKLNQHNGNFVSAEMVKAFITSTEYKHRFGQ